MAKQLWLNNFTTTFVASVKDAPVTGTPATELDYGILRLSDGAAGLLVNPGGGDYYTLTTYKKSGSTESSIEIMRVTAVDNATPGECRITVDRAQEGTSLQAYVSGDYASLRLTKGGAGNLIQNGDKDISGGVPGLTLFKLNLRNAADTFTSWLTNTNTAARTYTLPDADGMLADIASAQILTNKTWNSVVIAGQYGGTGVANTGKTITLGGNLTTTGAFASTFTMSGAYTYTFPGATGTLADIASAQAFTNKSYNGMTLTSTTGTFTLTAGKTLAATNTLTLSGTDGTVMTFPPATASVGYLNIPQNSQSTAYTLVLADAGKHILHPSADTTARTMTIPANSSVAYPVGTAITFVNQASAGVMTIAITTDTMRLAGAGTTGSRSLAANGIATAIKLTATEWIISGTGLT